MSAFVDSKCQHLVSCIVANINIILQHVDWPDIIASNGSITQHLPHLLSWKLPDEQSDQTVQSIPSSLLVSLIDSLFITNDGISYEQKQTFRTLLQTILTQTEIQIASLSAIHQLKSQLLTLSNTIREQQRALLQFYHPSHVIN
jgi:hypothetical protein